MAFACTRDTSRQCFWSNGCSTTRQTPRTSYPVANFTAPIVYHDISMPVVSARARRLIDYRSTAVHNTRGMSRSVMSGHILVCAARASLWTAEEWVCEADSRVHLTLRGLVRMKAALARVRPPTVRSVVPQCTTEKDVAPTRDPNDVNFELYMAAQGGWSGTVQAPLSHRVTNLNNPRYYGHGSLRRSSV